MQLSTVALLLMLESLECFQFSDNEDSKHLISRTIWSFWDSNPPEDVIDIINISKITLSNFTYIFLTLENVTLYLQSFPLVFKDLITQHKADFIRLALLERYGGIWIDASMYVNSNVVCEFFLWKAFIIKSDLSGYGRGYPHSYFLVAPRNSSCIRIWKAEYVTAIELGLERYKKVTGGRLSTYLTIDMCLINAFKNHKKKMRSIRTMIFKSSIYSAYQLSSECCHSKACFYHRLQCDPNVWKMVFIKVKHKDRDWKKANWDKVKYVQCNVHNKLKV